MASPKTIVEFNIPTAEKRREGGKHYAYEIIVKYSDGSKDRIWRRYSQFDALRDTIQAILGPETELPRLTRKLYLKRSAVHEVAIHRQPKLLRFLAGLLEQIPNQPKISSALAYFLTPTAADAARASVKDPEDLLRFDGTLVHRKKRSSNNFLISGEQEHVQALGDVTAETSEELSFKAGDVLVVVAHYDDGWLECELKGQMGLVSPEYVEKVNPSEEPRTSQQISKPASAIEELKATEQQFLENLIQVRDEFFPRLRALVTAPEAKIFFNNWAELIPLHEAFLQELNGTQDINITVEKHLRLFEMPYCRYCSGIPLAQDLYEEKSREKAFVKFEASYSSLNKPTLNHFMRPFQRVLKYPLLLREIMTTQGDVQRAFDAAAYLAEQANITMNNPQHRINKDDISAPEDVLHTSTSSGINEIEEEVGEILNKTHHDSMLSSNNKPASVRRETLISPNISTSLTCSPSHKPVSTKSTAGPVNDLRRSTRPPPPTKPPPKSCISCGDQEAKIGISICNNSINATGNRGNYDNGNAPALTKQKTALRPPLPPPGKKNSPVGSSKCKVICSNIATLDRHIQPQSTIYRHSSQIFSIEQTNLMKPPKPPKPARLQPAKPTNPTKPTKPTKPAKPTLH